MTPDSVGLIMSMTSSPSASATRDAAAGDHHDVSRPAQLDFGRYNREDDRALK